MDKYDNNNAFSIGVVIIIAGVLAIVYGHYILGPLAIVFGLMVCAGSNLEKKKMEEEDAEKAQETPTVRVIVDKEKRDPQLTFSIKGINYRDLDDSFLGDFVGTARALKSNPHDPYAIGVYIGSRRVGFLPGGNSELHARILDMGGSVDAEGFIDKGKDDEDEHEFYYGRVTLIM